MTGAPPAADPKPVIERVSVVEEDGTDDGLVNPLVISYLRMVPGHLREEYDKAMPTIAVQPG